jgi:hypothetical protein
MVSFFVAHSPSSSSYCTVSLVHLTSVTYLAPLLQPHPLSTIEAVLLRPHRQSPLPRPPLSYRRPIPSSKTLNPNSTLDSIIIAGSATTTSSFSTITVPPTPSSPPPPLTEMDVTVTGRAVHAQRDPVRS